MKATLWQDILALTVQYRKSFIIAFIMLLVSNCLTVLNPLIFRQAVLAMDPASGDFNEGPSPFFERLLGENLYSLYPWIIILLTVAFISAYFKYTMRYAFISISREAEKRVRSILFGRIQDQSRSFFDQHGIGELMSRLTNDISAYREMLGPGIMFPLYFITLAGPALIALFIISKPLATLSLLPIFILPVLIFVMQGYFYRTSMKVQESLAEISTMAQEQFSSIRIIKGYTAETASISRFKKASKHLTKLNMRLASLHGIFFPLLTFITKSVTVLLVLLAGFIILRAWEELSAADFISFMWVQSYLFIPILMLGWVVPMYQRGNAAYDRLVEIYQEPIEVNYAPEPSAVIQPKSSINFRNLTFTYPSSQKAALSGLNLQIQGGSWVGITGPVGAGKTTLFNLLMREYEVPPGTLLIGGKDIHEFSQEALREEVVSVEQTPFLFSRTIAENVRFDREGATQEEIESVTRLADLHETVMLFPDRYETQVGERGMALSGGQKQRIAIARAFLGEHSILLLDDIFSAIDAETEKKIFTEIKKKFVNRTVLLISHRISVLEKMDRVIYLRDGSVIEDGSPQELLGKPGHFSALSELQKAVQA